MYYIFEKNRKHRNLVKKNLIVRLDQQIDNVLKANIKKNPCEREFLYLKNGVTINQKLTMFCVKDIHNTNINTLKMNEHKKGRNQGLMQDEKNDIFFHVSN